MLGQIQTGFNTEQPDPYTQTGGTPEKTQRLVNRFAKEQINLWLLKSQDVQSAFADWLEERAKRDANKLTVRKEIKEIRNFAQKNGLDALSIRADALLLDTRNNVANLSRNFEVSRLITQDTVVRLMEYFSEADEPQATRVEYEAIQIFLLTCMTGLRTIEWKTVKLVLPPCQILPGETVEHPHLVVQTAKSKTTEPRTRHLILDAFSDSQLDSLNHSIQFFQSASSGTRSQLVVRARSVLQRIYANNPPALALLRTIDYRAARKIYTVELRRGGATMKEAAAALGHTSINNVRYYNHGDISSDRLTSLPLARAPRGIIETIKDPLENLNRARQAQGLGPISGYTQLPGEPGQDNQTDHEGESSASTVGRNLLDQL